MSFKPKPRPRVVGIDGKRLQKVDVRRFIVITALDPHNGPWLVVRPDEVPIEIKDMEVMAELSDGFTSFQPDGFESWYRVWPMAIDVEQTVAQMSKFIGHDRDPSLEPITIMLPPPTNLPDISRAGASMPEDLEARRAVRDENAAKQLMDDYDEMMQLLDDDQDEPA